jgi:DNA-binding MarR family transcriptional regulator
MSLELAWEQEARRLISERPGVAAMVVRLQARPISAAGLTRRQRHALDFIRYYLTATTTVPPSYDEIKVALGLKSKGEVHRIITALVARGYLTRRYGVPRSIALVGA